MKQKIKITSKDHLLETISTLQQKGYRWSVAPSIRVTHIILMPDVKKLTFEYGEDRYYEDVPEFVFEDKVEFTPEQIEAVVDWMNGWSKLRCSSVPVRFREDFSK